VNAGIATNADYAQPVDSGSYAKAILNILEDFREEKVRFQSTQKAIQNILEDAEAEKLRLKVIQKVVLNILEDSASEKTRLELIQRATFNIFDDLDAEKKNAERTNHELVGEIAERKRAEEALEAVNKELEAFSYSVSHDLRAPLRAIDGFSQALIEDYPDRLDEQGRYYLERVRAGTQRMGELIDDMLQLSRLTRVEMRFEMVNISVLAESVIADLRRAEPQRQVEVLIQQDMIAEGDANLQRIVLVNLLANAWKFTGRQSDARIELGTMGDDDGLVFFVRDNGAGFDMNYVSKLFGAFQRLHTTGEFPGTGIGLATVQRIIRRHGGRIWAEGAVNKGATFYFALPSNRNGRADNMESKNIL
jgi:light-regulated signal transduction histidine kinase (bacteriophytochrome)